MQRKRNVAGLFAAYSVMSVIAGVFFLGAFFYTQHNMEILKKDGVQQTAIIDRKYRSGGRGSNTPYIAYHFADAQGVMQTDHDAYPFSDWSGLRIGDTIDITYLPYDPGTNCTTRRMEMILHRTFQQCIPMFVAPWLMAVIFGALAIYYRRKIGSWSG